MSCYFLLFLLFSLLCDCPDWFHLSLISLLLLSVFLLFTYVQLVITP